MRLSCNGCRVLRKGCSESCSIRPCLQWIKSPDAQSNATVFLAKFYGRAGLLNLINAAGSEENHRPAVFRSLLYEACGRIVNPIYGSVGLLCSGNWHMCQAAVEAVLNGKPIVRISDDLMAAATPAHHLLQKAYYDIRHTVSDDNNKKQKKKRKSSADDSSAAATTCNNKVKKRNQQHPNQDENSDHASAVSDHHHNYMVESMNDSDDDAEVGSHVSQTEHNHQQEEEEQQQRLGLDLRLGFAPVSATAAGQRETATGTGWIDAEPGFAGFQFL